MNEIKYSRIKYSTYIACDVVQAVKNFAHIKGVSANYVIEAALRKCLPEKYYPEKV